jgi:hypothetical protein
MRDIYFSIKLISKILTRIVNCDTVCVTHNNTLLNPYSSSVLTHASKLKDLKKGVIADFVSMLVMNRKCFMVYHT